jgi:hypothetical protein
VRRHDDLRRAMRQQLRDLLDHIHRAEGEVLRLAKKERELALADGVPCPRVVAQGYELHALDGVDHLLLDPAAAEDPAAPIALMLPVPCADCGAHDRPVTLAPIGTDADGVPVLWDGQVLPGGPH